MRKYGDVPLLFDPVLVIILEIVDSAHVEIDYVCEDLYLLIVVFDFDIQRHLLIFIFLPLRKSILEHFLNDDISIKLTYNQLISLLPPGLGSLVFMHKLHIKIALLLEQNISSSTY